MAFTVDIVFFVFSCRTCRKLHRPATLKGLFTYIHRISARCNSRVTQLRSFVASEVSVLAVAFEPPNFIITYSFLNSARCRTNLKENISSNSQPELSRSASWPMLNTLYVVFYVQWKFPGSSRSSLLLSWLSAVSKTKIQQNVLYPTM